MPDGLTQRLLLAEHSFLAALQDGPQSLASFHHTLSGLQDVLSTAAKTGGVDNETLSLGHIVASRIMILANCFLDVLREVESSEVQLRNDCDVMIQKMTALDLNAQRKCFDSDENSRRSRSPPISKSPTCDGDSSSPPFFSSAYRWLLDNLHNPYPTTEVKAQIAATSSCQVSSINSWFANARRRIGWTTLCRVHFSNSRADMIDAAYRALVEEDPQRALSPELRHSFITMKVKAEDLYSSTFTGSAFGVDWDAVLKDTMSNSKSFEAGKRNQDKQANTMKGAQHSYPSPDRSITASPLPSFIGSPIHGGEEQDAVPPIFAGSKRCWSSSAPASHQSLPGERPTKRLRASTTPQIHLPSPPSSTNSIDSSSDAGSREVSPVHPAQPKTIELLPSRKRRLSDVDTINAPKRPRGSMVASYPDTISDPLPRPIAQNEQSIDEWINSNFGALFNMPPPVDATEPKLTADWEVELFKNYGIAEKFACGATVETSVSATADFDSLLQSIVGDIFVAPSGSMPPSNLLEPSYMASFDSSIPHFSETEWSALLNGPDAYQSPGHSLFPQYSAESQPLSEIDLSMLQLPQIMPSVDSEMDLVSKQAKLDQLHAMQEAVRRMEQELQSEGIEM